MDEMLKYPPGSPERSRLLKELRGIEVEKTGVHKPGIEDYYIRMQQDIPGATYKIVEALMKYAEKVKQKRMYYSASEQKWYPFDPDERLEDELDRIDRSIWRLKERQFDVESFNNTIRFVLKNMIMGGIE